MNGMDRDVKPWTPWPLTKLMEIAFYKALLYCHPQLILAIISRSLAQFHSLPGLVRRRVGRRERVLAWLNKVSEEKTIPDIQTVWDDGSILCAVINKIIPGLNFPDKTSLKVAQNMAFLYLGVVPAFTEEELCQETFYPHLERRLVRYLSSLQSAIARQKWPLQPDPSPPASSCLARGMGLITATSRDPAHFYLYLVDSTLALGDISVELQSDQDFGFARIDNKYATTLPRKFANIPIKFVLNNNSLRINYTPQNSGLHQLSIFRKGFHIQGSPFSVAVDKNNPRKLFKSNMQETGRTPRKKLRVLLRIVDFVTEKMLLTDDGKLKSISPQDFIAFQRDKCAFGNGLMKALRQESVPDASSALLMKPRDDPICASAKSDADIPKIKLSLDDSLDSVDSQLNIVEQQPTNDKISLQTDLDTLDKKLLIQENAASQISPSERESRENQTSYQTEAMLCPATQKGFEFKNRCKKIIAACHFIMNHGSKQKRDDLLSAAGYIFDGRPVKLDNNIENLLSVFPDMTTEYINKEPILSFHEYDEDDSLRHSKRWPSDVNVVENGCSVFNYRDSDKLERKPSNDKICDILSSQNCKLNKENFSNVNQIYINQSWLSQMNENIFDNEQAYVLDDCCISTTRHQTTFVSKDCVSQNGFVEVEEDTSKLNKCGDISQNASKQGKEIEARKTKRKLMFVDNVFHSSDEVQLEWYNDIPNESLNNGVKSNNFFKCNALVDADDTDMTINKYLSPLSSDSLDSNCNQNICHEVMAGPASSSSPCLFNDGSPEFGDIDAYLSKDFTAYMKSETQFHLWPSDVAFGEQSQASASDYGPHTNLNSVSMATNVEEALIKLEQGMLKNMCNSNVKILDNGKDNVLNSTLSKCVNDNHENEKILLMQCDDSSYGSQHKQKNEQLLVDSNTKTYLRPQNIRIDLITNNLGTSFEELQKCTNFSEHENLETNCDQEVYKSASHTIQEEDGIDFNECSTESSNTIDNNASGNGVSTDEEDVLVVDNIPDIEVFPEVIQQDYSVQEPIEGNENYNGQEDIESGNSSCEENQSPFPDSDSAYLSIDDNQSSFGPSPENRAHEDNAQWGTHRNENNYAEREDIGKEWRNLALAGFMGPAEKEVLGICNQEPEERNWQASRNFRVLTPLMGQMSAIVEEVEIGENATNPGEYNLTESSLNSLSCEEKYTDKAESSLSGSSNLYSFHKESRTKQDININHTRVENSEQKLPRTEIRENTSILPNECTLQENSTATSIRNIFETSVNDKDVVLNFIYLDNKQKIIELVDTTGINFADGEIENTITQHFVSEMVLEWPTQLLTQHLNNEPVGETNQCKLLEKADCNDKTFDNMKIKQDLASSNSSVEITSNCFDISNDQIAFSESQPEIFNDGFPVAMKVKLRKEFWDKKLLGCQQTIFKKPFSSNKSLNYQSDLNPVSNNSSLKTFKGTGNEIKEVYSQVNMSKIVKKWRNALHVKSEASSIAPEAITADEKQLADKEYVVDDKCDNWNTVLERNVTPPPKVRSPSLHHARPVLVREECDDNLCTQHCKSDNQTLCAGRDLVMQRRQQQIIASGSSLRYQKMNKDEIRSRFERAKQFFQTLEHNSFESDAPTANVRKRKGKRKKQCKASSAPCSDSETATRTNRPTGSLITGGSERIKVVDRFHVKDLFKDVIGDSDDGFMKGIPHRAAVLKALQSMKFERPDSPYEEADYCCPHLEHTFTEKHSSNTDPDTSQKNPTNFSLKTNPVYFV